MPIRSIPDLPRMLSEALEHAETALCINDDGQRLLYCNRAFGRLLGHAPESLVGRPFDELVDARPAANDRVEALVRCHDGRRIWCGIASTGLNRATGEPDLQLLALTEITQSKIHEVLLDRLLEGMARDEPPEHLMEAACLEIERLLPRTSASVLRVNAGRLHPLAGPSLPPAYLQALDGLPLGDGPGSEGAWAGEVERHPLWSAYRHLLPPELRSCSITPIRSSTGQLIGSFVCYGRGEQAPCATQQCLLDICTHLCALVLERDQARTRIHQLAYYDDLTGLPNRHLLQNLASAELAGAAARRQGLAVLYIGLDRFRQINDSFGRPSGDELLRTIARRLRQACRDEDHVGRQANDEFVVLLPGCDRAAASVHLARLKAALDAPWRVAGAPHNPSASIGISLFPEDGEDFQSLLRHAAMAMNQAKGKGKSRGGQVFFSEELERLAQERVALESALREALARQRLHLNYQPLVDIRAGRLRGAEVLARWHHPQLGNISPERFIPLSEECGLSIELGRWVLREACRQLAEWRHAGLQVPEISVNLSAGDFQDPQLPVAVLRTLEEHGLHGTDLTLEITESALMEADSDTLGVLDQLHELGIRLALDDFGTGYSSLARLNRLPVQELKLDRSFVRDLESNSTSRTLSDAVLNIGRSLGMTVVAEGIENPEQLRILEAQGYRVAQGYLLSPPLPAEGFAAWLKARQLAG